MPSESATTKPGRVQPPRPRPAGLARWRSGRPPEYCEGLGHTKVTRGGSAAAWPLPQPGVTAGGRHRQAGYPRAADRH